MTDANLRFTVNTDRMAVYDTETDLYSGFLFAETAQEIADRLNSGEFNTTDHSSFFDWETDAEWVDLTEEEVNDKRTEAVLIADLYGVAVPEYARRWYTESGNV
jgi:hypothetical protein